MACPEGVNPFVIEMKRELTINKRNHMKIKTTAILSTLLLAATTWAGPADQPKARQSSPEFDRLKTLVGTWQGKTDMGQGPVDITLQYRLLAGGSVLEERVFAGTPNEMVTMYFEQGGKLALTHYCIMGNRPGMLLKSSDGNSISFDFDKTCGIDTQKESHMHALTITFDDANTITTECKAMIDGKEAEAHPTTLKRVKS
jgi:hypothetical protein